MSDLDAYGQISPIKIGAILSKPMLQEACPDVKPINANTVVSHFPEKLGPFKSTKSWANATKASSSVAKAETTLECFVLR